MKSVTVRSQAGGGRIDAAEEQQMNSIYILFIY